MTFIKGVARLGAAMLIGLLAPSAQAGYVVDLTQEGSNVIATGSGAIDLTGLTFLVATPQSATLGASSASIVTGPLSESIELYTGVTGPSNFGSGGLTGASSGSGDLVGVGDFGEEVGVPTGYVSESPLLDTSTYNGQTFSSLGVTPGTYKWTWGSGANQNVTLVIGAAIPESSTWAMMALGFVGLGFVGWRGPRKTVPHTA